MQVRDNAIPINPAGFRQGVQPEPVPEEQNQAEVWQGRGVGIDRRAGYRAGQAAGQGIGDVVCQAVGGFIAGSIVVFLVFLGIQFGLRKILGM